MDQPPQSPAPQVERFREYLCLLARTQLPPGHPSKLEASDIVQQTLLEAYEQRGDFRGQSDAELAAWLKQMLVHNMADALRGARREKRDVRREQPLEVAIEDSLCRAEGCLATRDASPSQQAMRIEQLLILAEVLAELPAEQRDAVAMHHLQGWTQAQLAERWQRSEPSIAGLLRRGLKNIRELMKERGVTWTEL